MIQLIRVDDRLLHGQVAYSWKGELNYEALIIVSNEAANDEIRKSAIKMAKPDGVRLAIRNVESSIEILNDARIKKLKTFVVTDKIENADLIMRNIKESVKLNIGGLQKKDNKKPITSFAYVSENDIDILEKLDEDKFPIEFRLVPSDQPRIFNRK